MGNFFSSKHAKPPVIINDEEQFFDCLNDDEPHEQDIQIQPPVISHYYAVSIPSNVEITENQFVFDDMKSAFALCKKYSKHNSRVKIFANRIDAENFINQQRNNISHSEELNMPIEPVTKPVNNDAEKLPYSDVPTAELTKLYNLVDKGDANEFERLVWTNPRYLISSGDSPTIVKISVRYNCMHVAALTGQSMIIRLLIKTIKNIQFIRRLYVNDTEEQTQKRIRFILDMYLNTPDKMQNETPLHLATKFGHYEAVRALLDESSCSRDAVNKSGSTAQEIICTRAKDKCQEKKIRQLFESVYYIPIYNRKVTMEKNVSKPVDENTFKPFLNTIEQVSSSLPIECDNDMTLIAFAGPTNYDLAMKFYTSVLTSTRGQARRTQNLLASPQSPVYIVRSDAEKGWERIARTYALETYSLNWCEYWPFLDSYTNLSSIDGLQLLEYYLQQRVLHSQILKSIDQLEKFSSHYLAKNKGKISNENDLVLNSLAQLIQLFYSLMDLFNLHEFVLNRKYLQHIQSGGFDNEQQNPEFHSIKNQLLQQFQWLSLENRSLLPLFTRPLLNCLTMVFTLIISASGCALIDQIQQNQYESRRSEEKKIRSTSRLSLIGLVCPKRKQARRSFKPQRIHRSYSWPDLTSNKPSSTLSRCSSQNNLNEITSVNFLTEKSQLDFSNQSSQLSLDMFKEDKTKLDKWHYFLAGSQPTKLDAHVIRAIDITRVQYRLSSKWYQAVQMRPIEEQNLWTTPNRTASPSNRKVLHPGENQSSLLKTVTRQAFKRKLNFNDPASVQSKIIEKKRSKN